MLPVNLALGRYKLNHLHETALSGSVPDFSSPENPVPSAPAAIGDYIIPNQTGVLNQGDLGSCAANAGAGALGLLLAQEGKFVELSRLFWYGAARKIDGTFAQDAGTYIRSICQQAHKVGVCAEDLWPYVNVLDNFCKDPPLEANIRASENRINGFYRITSEGDQRLSDIATAIRANHPVIFGTQVGKSFINNDGHTPAVPDPNDMQGGHATHLVGVKSFAGRYYFLDKNSWGPGWANGGYCWLDQDYMTWEKTSEIYVFTRMDPIL